jgi:4a-hydroxytetrahydrobiopterin dehydratase
MMPRPFVMSPKDLTAALKTLPGWSLRDGKLHKEFVFADFGEAFGFMAKVALEADRMDHHPEWSNSHRKVVVELVTHAAGGVTELDLRLARACDEAAGG